MKRLFFLCSVLLVVLLAATLAVGCQQQTAPAPPTEEAPPSVDEVVANCAVALEELNSKAMLEITTQIADLDKRIAEIEEQETQLREINAKIDDTVAYFEEEMAEEELVPGIYWYFNMPEEDFNYFENNYYQLVNFKLVWQKGGEGWRLFSEISIMDKATKDPGIPAFFEKKVSSSKSHFVSSKIAKEEAKEEASQILTDVLKYKDAWKIMEVQEKVYSISGYGLGYTEQLSVGEWYYYEDPKVIEPKSSASRELMRSITAGVQS